jgi:hypothetical protein
MGMNGSVAGGRLVIEQCGLAEPRQVANFEPDSVLNEGFAPLFGEHARNQTSWQRHWNPA